MNNFILENILVETTVDEGIKIMIVQNKNIDFLNFCKEDKR